MLGFTFWFYIKGKEDLVTSSSESVSIFRSSGLELLPTLLPAAALQPSAVPVELLSVVGTTPHPGSLSHGRLAQVIF